MSLIRGLSSLGPRSSSKVSGNEPFEKINCASVPNSYSRVLFAVKSHQAFGEPRPESHARYVHNEKPDEGKEVPVIVVPAGRNSRLSVKLDLEDWESRHHDADSVGDPQFLTEVSYHSEASDAFAMRTNALLTEGFSCVLRWELFKHDSAIRAVSKYQCITSSGFQLIAEVFTAPARPCTLQMGLLT